MVKAPARHLRMFDWNDLRYFLAVAHAGSTRAAAKALGVNQSTVHRRLDELERQIGRRLLARGSTGYKLTELGKDMVAHAGEVEDAVSAFQRHLAASNMELSGVIHVTCPEVLGLRLMRSDLVKAFNAKHPSLRVEVLLSDKYFDLAKGEADIALRACAPVPDDPNLFGRKIAPSPWAVYASQAYVKRHGGIELIEEIGRHAIIIFENTVANHPASRWLHSVAPNAVVSARVAGVPAGLSAVKSGAGVGVLPVIVGDNEDDLRRLYGPIPNLPSDIYLLIHQDMKQTPRVRAFFDYIVAELPAVRRILDTGGLDRDKRRSRKGH